MEYLPRPATSKQLCYTDCDVLTRTTEIHLRTAVASRYACNNSDFDYKSMLSFAMREYAYVLH